MKRLFQNLALVLASLILCAVFGEIAVRILYPRIANYNMEMWHYASKVKQRTSNPKLPFLHAPNRSGFFYGAEIQTDSVGFRDRDYPVARVPGKRRIMLLGDSFTLGWGVPFDSMFSKQLEKLLNQNGQPTEVINTGVGNTNTVMELEQFKEIGLRFKPDMVILMYFINDAEPTPPVVGALKTAIITHSYLIAFLSDQMIKLTPRVNQSYDWRAYYSGLFKPGRPGMEASRQAIDELALLCKHNGIKLVIANIPELRELKNYPFPEATEFVRSAAESNDVPFVDLLPALVSEDPATLWVTKADPHANAKANGIIGRALFDAVNEIDSPRAKVADRHGRALVSRADAGRDGDRRQLVPVTSQGCRACR
jgi:lysophospholipase L1-like esterase